MTWDELDEAENACSCGNFGYDELPKCDLCHETVCSICEGYHVSRECIEPIVPADILGVICGGFVFLVGVTQFVVALGAIAAVVS